MKKKKLALIITLICLLTAALITLTVNAQQSLSVYVNSKLLSSEAYIINDRVFVPLRAVSESMGADVSWDDATRSAYINSDDDALIPEVIKDVSESVVAIVGKYKPEYMSDQALSYNDAYGHGAGAVIKSNGTILTNAHVVKDFTSITVIFGNGESYAGTIQYIDEKSDLAVVKINKLGLKPIKFGTDDDIVAGKTVIAIGTPVSLNMLNSASKGIISGKNVNINQYYYLTQSDTAINGGNSGGPLINTKGELIGINSSKYVGTSIEGMSFSIPVNTINYVLNQFEKNGRVIRPDIGVSFIDSWEAKLGLPYTKGVTVVSSTIPQLTANDVVTSINGVTVNSITDYNEALKNTYTGGDISITFTRNGQQLSTSITPKLN